MGKLRLRNIKEAAAYGGAGIWLTISDDSGHI